MPKSEKSPTWKRFSQVFTRGTSAAGSTVEPDSPSLCPEFPFVVVGDVHGRADLMLELDRLIEARCPGWPVVFLGDYVDRGDQSREVLELLFSVSPESTPPVTCLMGNHERMLLAFLEDPAKNGARWINNGGLQTLASFGIAPPRGGSADAAALAQLRDRLEAEMGAPMIDWLRARPLSWRSGNVWAVHAGADPDLPMIEQPRDVLLWGHPEFPRRARSDGQWVVHGHTVVEAPQVRDGRISVDTGAYATGKLSAAAVTHDGASFIQTGTG
jgi:serine/threonine protein phosphatase 1